MSTSVLRGRVLALVGAVVVCAGSGGGAVAAAQRAAQPSIRPLSINPLRVRGMRFEPRERVRVIAFFAGGRRARQTRAGVSGAFTVDFGRIGRYERCSFSLYLTAVGSAGSRAAFKLPSPECPVPLRP